MFGTAPDSRYGLQGTGHTKAYGERQKMRTILNQDKTKHFGVRGAPGCIVWDWFRSVLHLLPPADFWFCISRPLQFVPRCPLDLSLRSGPGRVENRFDVGCLIGPGGAQNPSQKAGGFTPPFWNGLWGRRGRPDPKNHRFPAGPKTMY